MMVRTYQARVVVPTGDAGLALLEGYAGVYGKAERALFAQLSTGAEPGKIKPSFMAKHGLTARQYNALSRAMGGKVRSIQEIQKLRISDLKGRIEGLQAKLPKLAIGSNKRHQKTRRLGTLQQRLDALKQDRKDGRIRICFGGRKLFRAQSSLQENGYADHAAWLADWRAARADEVFVLGSKDETGGCVGCQMVHLGNGRFSLKLRLPNGMIGGEKGEKHLSLEATFSYGLDAILAALARGQALSYRFVRDPRGCRKTSTDACVSRWRVLVSTNVAGGEALPAKFGFLGLDINEDHLALAETDGEGNLVAIHRIDLVLYGCTTEQAKARVGDAMKQVIALAKAVGKPIAAEELDFTRKKRDMKDSGVRYARMLSSFSYSRIMESLKARAFDAGIQIIEVNPAFTSIIGRSKFARRYGISVHGSAAMVIARRAQGFSERPNPSKGHGTSPAPVRKRGEHVWSFWGKTLRGERRMQRPLGRPKRAIPTVTGPAKGHGASGIKMGPSGPGGIPVREQASGHPPEVVSNTVREAYHG